MAFSPLNSPFVNECCCSRKKCGQFSTSSTGLQLCQSSSSNPSTIHPPFSAWSIDCLSGHSNPTMAWHPHSFFSFCGHRMGQLCASSSLFVHIPQYCCPAASFGIFPSVHPIPLNFYPPSSSLEKMPRHHCPLVCANCFDVTTIGYATQLWMNVTVSSFECDKADGYIFY